MRRALFSRLPFVGRLCLDCATSHSIEWQTQRAAYRALRVSSTAGVQSVRGRTFHVPAMRGLANNVGFQTAARRCGEAAAGSAARAQPLSDAEVDIDKLCLAVAKQIAPQWQGDNGDLAEVSTWVAWSPSVEKELSKANLRPLSGNDARAEYERATDNMDAVNFTLGMASVKHFGGCLARKFKYDPRPKTFLDAAVEMGESKDLAHNDTVHVLAKDAAKAKSALNRLVTSPTPKLAEPQLAIREDQLKRKVIVLHGPSGCGKTTAALHLAIERRGACCMVLPDDPGVPMCGLDGNEKVDDRNKLVSADLIARVQAMVPEGYRTKPNGKTQRPLVVVLDEFAGQHHYVRGVIGHRHHIVTELERTVTGGNPVYLVVAGTGIEGVLQEPGSMPSNYALRLVQPAVWQHVHKQLPSPVLKLLEVDGHPDVQLALQLVRNARACVLFVNTFLAELLQRVVPPDSARSSKHPPYSYTTPIDVRIVRFAATAAAAEFVQLNGLSRLTSRGLMDVMLDAVAVQAVNKHAASDQDHQRMLRVKRTYGLVADRAIVKLDSDVDPSDYTITPLGDGSQQPSDGKPVLVLEEKYNGVRFEVDPGAMAVLQLVLGFGAPDASPDAFEVSTRDFVTFAVHASEARFKPSPGWGELFPEPLETTPKNWRISAGCDSDSHSRWRYPLELVTLLRCLRAGADQSDVAFDVLRYRASHEIVSVEDLNKAILHTAVSLPGADGVHVAHVVVNRDKASAQDISVKMGDVVLKVQCKLAESQKLAERDVFKELHKMGNRDWRCVLAAWMSRGKEDRTPKKTSAIPKKQPASPNPKGKPNAFVGAPSEEDWQKLEAHAERLRAGEFLTNGTQGSFGDAVRHLQFMKTEHSAEIDDLIALLMNLTRRAADAVAPDPPTVHYALVVHGVPQTALEVDLPDNATVYASDRGDATAHPRSANVADKRLHAGDAEGTTVRLLRGLYPAVIGRASPAYGLSMGPRRETTD